MAQTGFSTANSEDDIRRIRENSDSVIVMQPGQQSELMYRTEFETLLGGQKGSCKSISSIVRAANGFHKPAYLPQVISDSISDQR